MNSSPFGSPTRLVGEIAFEETGSSFSGATVYVRLEDTSRADAAAQLVAEQVLQQISHTRGDPKRVQFSLEAPGVDERNRYSVRVHVDVDGDEEISRGDFLSMVSYPVLTQGHPNRVTVHVKELK